MSKFFKNLAFFVLMLISASCGKEGAIGPAGPPGPQGEQGNAGVKGADGTMILNGSSDPTVGEGKVGDFYINTKDGLLYGPKTTSGWGIGTSLKGNEGASGSQFLAGTKVPDTETGKIGDFYFRTSNSMLYGPKNANGWGSGVSLQAKVIVNEGVGWAQLKPDGEPNGTKWRRSAQAWNMQVEAPGDIGLPFNYNWWLGSFNLHSGAFAVYVDDGNGIRMCNFQLSVRKLDNNMNVLIDADLEFRFVVAPTSYPTMAHYLYPVVAVKRGTVDATYMADVYLPSLKWKVVSIPANMANRNDINWNNYFAVIKALKSN